MVLLPPLPNIMPVNGDLAYAKDYVDSLDWSRRRERGSYLRFHILITLHQTTLSTTDLTPSTIAFNPFEGSSTSY